MLIYLGVDVIAVWGLNLQVGVAGLVNFAFIIFQAAGAYTAAVLTLGPAQPASQGGFQQYVGGAHWPFPLPILAWSGWSAACCGAGQRESPCGGCAVTTRRWSCSWCR